MKFALPILLMTVFALTRIPELMPHNFSAVYAIAFCAGVYFPKKMAWWIPMLTFFFTDMALNCYYQFQLAIDVFKISLLIYLAMNYVAYAVLIGLGRKFSPQSSFASLLGGGIFGALLFYFITNTASWFFNPFHNPEYTKTVAGWIDALTRGTHGWPQTWEFFRNTVLSGGLFTGLFVGAMKLSAASEPAEEKPEEKSEEKPAENPDAAQA
ncbi:MAG: DUF6580 family putative transport protein [Limisphaerales bacterium]